MFFCSNVPFFTFYLYLCADKCSHDKKLNKMKLKAFLTTTLLLIFAGTVQNLLAQSTLTVGSKITAESSLVSGKAYLIYLPHSCRMSGAGLAVNQFLGGD